MENLFQLVARHAAHSPSKLAVSRWSPGHGFAETSYGDLWRKARQFAQLCERLTPPQAMVPLLAGKSADTIAFMLGAVATARPFCFLNAKYRGPQVAAVLDATKSPICITDAAGLVALRGAWQDYPQIARTTWLVVGEPELKGIYADAAAALGAHAEVLFVRDEGDTDVAPATRDILREDVPATCLFTSGSTGEPKGVLISEADLMGRVSAETAWFGLTSGDVLLSILPFSFDVGLNQLMTALAVGAELVLLDSWLPADILMATEKRNVTGISAVPSIWHDLIMSGARIDKRDRHRSLRYITISGGSLPGESLQRLFDVASGVEIFKTYGQTEAFRTTSLRPDEQRQKLDSVGKPFPGVRAYVVREDGTRCDAGEVGEVVHTGLGIMMGYLGEVNADAQAKLRQNPFRSADDPSPCAVFTGDMGYLDDEGYLYLKGRRDGMVKVMGNRVYPQEVAKQIVSVSGVRDAIVAGVPRAGGQTILVAFLSVAPDVDLPASSVRRTLSAKLPAFMIPKDIVFVDHIPRTPSGKPDQRRLVDEYTTRDAEPARERAPLNP